MAKTSQPDPGSSDELLAAAGIVVTPEGKARARRRLEEARAWWTPELDERLRRQIGLPTRAG